MSLNQLDCDSIISLQLLQNPDCASQYNADQFSILAKARTQFHVAALEATLMLEMARADFFWAPTAHEPEPLV